MVVGLFGEFRPSPTVPHPFATVPIPAGSIIDEGAVEYRDVPSGLFDRVSLPVTASHAILPGDPVLAGPDSPTSSGIPDGWWAVALELPTGAGPGAPVRLALEDRTVDGMIVSESDGQFGEHTGLVAVPEGSSEAVARAVRQDAIVVFVGR